MLKISAENPQDLLSYEGTNQGRSFSVDSIETGSKGRMHHNNDVHVVETARGIGLLIMELKFKIISH